MRITRSGGWKFGWVTAAAVIVSNFVNDADAAEPISIDPRLKVELFAESPQIKTPTGVDIDDRGRVWAIESNTHFRPENYNGHPSDRLLLMVDTTGDGRCDSVSVFADGFTHAMSVAVRPSWLREIKPEATAELRAGAGDVPITQVYVATRRAIWLLEDFTGDNVADTRTQIAWLETEGDYPHNGLAGFAFDALGWMYFGFGENLGAEYTISCLDGTKLSGGGEGGNMYRMRPNGVELTQWATGFWNPHASCVNAFGHLFTVDNDPDSRPPCRLLHVVEQGDYGYKFSNGRAGLHPFTSWNGEVPGTLPMVAGTGEAPSGILTYEHYALPEEFQGNLIVTSWGDHRIDRFRLKPKGASFESIPEPLITGDENFRPVGIALAPDGSMYCTDWVLRDYKLHGQGRIWKISPVDPPERPAYVDDWAELESRSRLERRQAATSLSKSPLNVAEMLSYCIDETHSHLARYEAVTAFLRYASGKKEESSPEANEADKIAWILSARAPGNPDATIAALILMTEAGEKDPNTQKNLLQASWQAAAKADDPFVYTNILRSRFFQKSKPALTGAWDELAKSDQNPNLPPNAGESFATLALLLARRENPANTEYAQLGLTLPFANAKRVAVQWAAEENMKGLRPQVEAVLNSKPMTSELFLATLAALDMLDGNPPKDFDRTPPKKYVLPLLHNDDTPAVTKLQALRLVPPDDKELNVELLTSLLESDNIDLKLEVINTLGLSNNLKAVPILQEYLVNYSEEFIEEEALVMQNTARLRRAAIAALANFSSSADVQKSLLECSGDHVDVIRALRGVATNHDLKKELLNRVSQRTGSAKYWEEVDAQLSLLPGGAKVPDREFFFPAPPQRPKNDDIWGMEMLVTTGDKASTPEAIEAGRLLFFHPHGPQCAKCHSIHGRGGQIGPSLSRIGASLPREKLLYSILAPSSEVAPQFTNWNIVTKSGKVHNGMIVFENKGETTLGMSNGESLTLKTADIKERRPVTTSVMPENLENLMTVEELRDLLNFLENLQ